MSEHTNVPEKTSSNGKLVHTEFSAQFAGPLPPPDMLAAYDRVVPGAAERILKMAEEQSRHRQAIEEKVISASIQKSKTGLWFGFIIGLGGLATSCTIALAGQPGWGSFMGLGSLAVLSSVFVYGSQQQKKERREKVELRDKILNQK